MKFVYTYYRVVPKQPKCFSKNLIDHFFYFQTLCVTVVSEVRPMKEVQKGQKSFDSSVLQTTLFVPPLSTTVVERLERLERLRLEILKRLEIGHFWGFSNTVN